MVMGRRLVKHEGHGDDDNETLSRYDGWHD